MACPSLRCKEIIVKPVYNDHLRDPEFEAVVERWSLFRGITIRYKKADMRTQKWWSLHAGLNFTNIFTSNFYARNFQKRKNSVKLSVSFYAFGTYGQKSCA